MVWKVKQQQLAVWKIYNIGHACMKSLECYWPLQSTRASGSTEVNRAGNLGKGLYEQFCIALSIPIQFILLRSTKKKDCVRIPTIILSAMRRQQYWWCIILYLLLITPLTSLYFLPCPSVVIWSTICWQTTALLINGINNSNCRINLLKKYIDDVSIYVFIYWIMYFDINLS